MVSLLLLFQRHRAHCLLSLSLPLHTGLGKFSYCASTSNAFNTPITREQV